VRRIRLPHCGVPARSQPNKAFIPVARIADMLLKPGEPFTYEGETYAYPDIRLVYWPVATPIIITGPRAFCGRVGPAETIVVQEIAWTATARRPISSFPRRRRSSATTFPADGAPT